MSTSTSNRCHVRVYPTGDEQDGINVSASVLSLSLDRSADEPAGRWSVTLLAPDEVSVTTQRGQVEQLPAAAVARILPMSVVTLGVDAEGSLALGFVGSIDRAFVRIGNAVRRTLTLSGQTAGRVLTDEVIRGYVAGPNTARFKRALNVALGDGDPAPSVDRIHPMAIPLLAEVGPLNATGERVFVGATIPDVVTWILTRTTAMQLPLLRSMLGGRGAPGDFIAPEVTDWPGVKVWSEAPARYQGAVQDYIRSIMDMDFWEVRVDERPPLAGGRIPRVSLVVRPRPWDDPVLEDAPVTSRPGLSWPEAVGFVEGVGDIEVDQDEVYNLRLSRADDTPSYYLVTSVNQLAGNVASKNEGLVYPLVDLYAARRFGARRKEATLKLLSPDIARKARAETGRFLDVEDYRNRLFNWLRYSWAMERGSITIQGRDDIRPGDPVSLPWLTPWIGQEKGLRFYARSVSWSWSSGGPYQVTVNIERGYNFGVIDAARALILRDARAARAVEPSIRPTFWTEG